MGCPCAVCHSSDPHDKRLRSAALVETAHTKILIDSGPDIRQQLMPLPFTPLDGVLLTHIHYDHVAGIDDLRAFCVFGSIDIYADQQTTEGLRHNMPYCFGANLYPGVPLLNLHTIQPRQSLQIGDLSILPITVMHGRMPILAYRIGKFAYVTDMKAISDEDCACLEGVEVLVVNALKWEKEHHSHMLVADAVAFANRIGAQKAYLTHLTHKIGFHEEANKKLPPHIQLGYDGLQLRIDE